MDGLTTNKTLRFNADLPTRSFVEPGDSAFQTKTFHLKPGDILGDFFTNQEIFFMTFVQL